MSGFFRTYLTFNFLARFYFSVSYSASVERTVANSMLFAPVSCNAGINKSSASHFCLVRVRILWLLAAGMINCLSLPFTYRTLCGRAFFSLPPRLPSLSFLPLPTHSITVPFLRLLFSERRRDCRELYAFFWHKAWVESKTRTAGEGAFSRSTLVSRISSLA